MRCVEREIWIIGSTVEPMLRNFHTLSLSISHVISLNAPREIEH